MFDIEADTILREVGLEEDGGEGHGLEGRLAFKSSTMVELLKARAFLPSLRSTKPSLEVVF